MEAKHLLNFLNNPRIISIVDIGGGFGGIFTDSIVPAGVAAVGALEVSLLV